MGLLCSQRDTFLHSISSVSKEKFAPIGIGKISHLRQKIQEEKRLDVGLLLVNTSRILSRLFVRRIE